MSRAAHWKPNEDATLRECVRKRFSAEATARIIGRPRDACVRRAYNLGLEIPDRNAWFCSADTPEQYPLPRKANPPRLGFAFSNVQARGADAGHRTQALGLGTTNPHLALRRFSWETQETQETEA